MKTPDPARLGMWDFVDESTGTLKSNAPKPADLAVKAASRLISVEQVGFRRRVRYATAIDRDLRVGSTVEVEAVSATVSEGGAPGQIRFVRKGDLSQSLKVRFSLGGSAGYNWDYNAFLGNYTNSRKNVIELAAGAAEASVPVQVLEDTYVEPTETLEITLLFDPAYNIGTRGRAVVGIQDND